jgi:hypothetical protein
MQKVLDLTQWSSGPLPMENSSNLIIKLSDVLSMNGTELASCSAIKLTAALAALLEWLDPRECSV